jgi:hypothetical protein
LCGHIVKIPFLNPPIPALAKGRGKRGRGRLQKEEFEKSLAGHNR